MKGKNQGGQCKCEGCMARFTGMRAFDMHRAGQYAMCGHTRRCLSADEMRKRGMRQNAKGAWGTGQEFDRSKLTA